MRIVQDEDLMSHAVQVGDHIQGRFREVQKELPIIGDVRGKGLMVAVELVNSDGSPAREAIKSLIKEMGARGLVLTKCGACSIRVAPPADHHQGSSRLRGGCDHGGGAPPSVVAARRPCMRLPVFPGDWLE